MKVWASTMRKISREPLELEAPENIDFFWVDSVQGNRSEQGCAGAIRMPFIRGSEPGHQTGCSVGRRVPSPGTRTDKPVSERTKVEDLF